jgi:inosine-uridine nucleoside N-ribohydrolase
VGRRTDRRARIGFVTPTKVILDVDTGTDDAVAVMLAALHPEIELVACTTVFGNHDVARCTDNTLRVLDHIGRGDIPVHEGRGGPLVPVALAVDPMAEVSGTPLHLEELPLPPARSTVQSSPAVEVLIETLRATTEPITLVATGCLTNVAAAVAASPDIVAAVDDLRIMGGGHEIGNVTPSAEANIYRDPEAAAVVLGAGFRQLTLVLLDATHRALVTRDDRS